jgi:squalene synthase HpnC
MSTRNGGAILTSAYAACERDARAHDENFPVASVVLPARMRPHVAAIYAFARVADDFADEGRLPPAMRLALLDGWMTRLHAAAASREAGPPPSPGEPPDTAAIFLALGASIRALRLPLALFDDLVSAFRQDVTVTRYRSWSDLIDYCRRSANPVGRLVLRVAGYENPALDRASDAVCTALQLTNFWQDLKIDFDRGRIYLPHEELAAHGAHEDDLHRGQLTPEWRSSLAAATARTRALFEQGRTVCDGTRGRLRHELRATWLGGMRILDRLEQSGFDPIAARPRLGWIDAPWFLWRMVNW